MGGWNVPTVSETEKDWHSFHNDTNFYITHAFNCDVRTEGSLVNLA